MPLFWLGVCLVLRVNGNVDSSVLENCDEPKRIGSKTASAEITWAALIPGLKASTLMASECLAVRAMASCRERLYTGSAALRLAEGSPMSDAFAMLGVVPLVGRVAGIEAGPDSSMRAYSWTPPSTVPAVKAAAGR